VSRSGTIRENDAAVGRPRWRACIAWQPRDALGRAAARRHGVDVEAVTAVGGKRDPAPIVRPGRFALRAGPAHQLLRIASVRLHRPDAVEMDDGEALAIR
jgi:hypothetical protein